MKRPRVLYPTILRAMDRLTKKGYLKEVESVRMKTDKFRRIPIYGLTLRGFIASLASDKVCRNVLKALESNKQVISSLPRDLFSPLREILGDKQIGNIARCLLKGFIKAIPEDLESVQEEYYSGYLVPTLLTAPRPNSYDIKEKDCERAIRILMTYPKVLDWFGQALKEKLYL